MMSDRELEIAKTYNKEAWKLAELCEKEIRRIGLRYDHGVDHNLIQFMSMLILDTLAIKKEE